jgi:protein gp37
MAEANLLVPLPDDMARLMKLTKWQAAEMETIVSETTSIEWCDATFNPWWGCQKVSPACDHCYAERDSKRFAPGRVLWGVGSERRTFGEGHWNEPLRWARTMPAKLGRRPRVFCASMGDWLDLDAPLDQFVRLLDTIRRTPELDWLLLSKRIGNWRKRLDEAVTAHVAALGCFGGVSSWAHDWLNGRAPANVWLGATVIDQAEADRDVPKLLATPARVRFLSIEPMLGPVDLSTHRGARALPLYWEGTPADGPMPNYCGSTGRRLTDTTRRGWVKTSENMSPWVNWVICGGESGPHARPMHPDWARGLRDQCAAAGVPFLFKQWGEWREPVEGEPYSTAMGRAQERPAFIVALDGTVHCFENERTTSGGKVMLRIGKKAAGRLLDGRTHDGFPA